MTRVQILLGDNEDRELEAIAARRGESKSSLVRRAVELLLRLEAQDREPLLALAGQAGRAGIRHGARDHDRLLAAAAQRRTAR
jgi:Arc/MetJ-type ribon-helix-helix transcriptional regulator